MNCPTCHRPMAVNGGYWFCGEHAPPAFVPVGEEVAGAAESEWLADVADAYPFPVACAYHRLRDDLLSHRDDHDALRQLILVKDCVETLVKYLALVVLAARLDRGERDDALDGKVLEALVAPALGTWAQMVLKPLVDADTTRADGRLAPLVAFASKQFFGRVAKFTELRNAVLGHGLVRAPHEDRADVNAWLPWLKDQLAGARFLAEWELVQAADPPRSWMGADALTRPRPPADPDRLRAAAAARPGDFLLFLAPSRPVSLSPFCALLICPGCAKAPRLFLYDSQKEYTEASKKVAMIESAGGHKGTFAEPARNLERHFAEKVLLEHFRRYSRHFEVLEGKLAEFDFDTYRQRVRHFVGRGPLLDAIGHFFKGQPVPLPDRLAAAAYRGYFLLVAEPGLGKTAVLTHWIDHNDVCPVPIRFFWRRGRTLTRLDFLSHVYHGLLAKHNIEDADPPRDEGDYPRKLDSLLKLVSEKYLAQDEREVIVIDGLDEAGDEGARALAVAAIPRELPRYVYFLLSSRPVRELDALAGEAKCLHYELKADADWNRADVREYVEQQLLGLVVTGEMRADLLPRVCDAADGNFLWAEQFCASVRTGQLTPGAVADALPRMRGLDGLYQEFWLRVVQGMPAEREARLWRVAGLLAVVRTAVTAEQLCHWAGLEDGEFIVLRSVLQQYLDEVVLPNERDPSAPLVGFRLYHASFRDFLARQPGFVTSQHHERIVNAYAGAGGGPPNYRTWDRYGLSSVVHHATQAQRVDVVERLLTDLPYLEAKAEAGLVFGLAADFALAARSLPADYLGLRPLRLLDEALRRDVHFIARHPTTVFQCLWNTCRWYDGPGAAAHVRSDLVRLTERWEQTRADAGRPPWVRSHCPPQVPLGSPQAAVYSGHVGPVMGVRSSHDGRRIASASGDLTIRIWDRDSGAELLRLCGHRDWVRAVAWSPDGSRLASVSRDRTLRIWDATSGEEIRCLTGHDSRVTGVAWSPDGTMIASASDDGTVLLWDAARGTERACLSADGHHVSGVAWSPDGGRVAAPAADAMIRIWSASAARELARLRGHENWVGDVAWSPDGSRLASASRDRTVRVWDAAAGAELACLSGGAEMTSVAWSPDGRRLAAGAADQSVYLWPAAGGDPTLLRGHRDEVRSVCWLGTGEHLASGSLDKTVRVWRTDLPPTPPAPPKHSADVSALVWSAGGRHLTSKSFDEAVDWPVGHIAAFSSGAAWSAASTATEVVIHSLETGREVAWFPGHMDIVEPHPSGRAWAACYGGYVYIISLEEM